MAEKQMAEQRADDRQPDTIAKHWAGDAYGALIAFQDA